MFWTVPKGLFVIGACLDQGGAGAVAVLAERTGETPVTFTS